MVHEATIDLQATISSELAGLRLDQALAKLFPDYSRSQHQLWIQAGAVTLNQEQVTERRHKVKVAESVCVKTTLSARETSEPQKIPLDIVYEDEQLIVINKPPGLVVHPGAGNPDQTLLNALMYHDPTLNTVPRAGIIHRLDKDTSGLLVIARDLPTHHYLIEAMKERAIKREYEAIVNGVLISGGRFDLPIGRHPTLRTRMAVVDNGQPATTHYRVIDRYQRHSRVHVQLETGRTHQIRVHFAHNRNPLVGDPVYGKGGGLPSTLSCELKETLKHFNRQALHACQLSLIHPISQKSMQWKAPLPEDMCTLITQLEKDHART